MKVILLNGSPHIHGCTATALDEMIKVFTEEGIETELIQVGNKSIRGCVSCGSCEKNGKCVFDDLVNETAPKFEAADGLVVGSPVYYGGPNGRLTSFLDRFFYSGGADKCQGMPGASVVSCRRGGASEAFERLNQYFLICNMNVVGSQYWNQVHGFTAEDVEKDEEGLQTMRTLAQNMAYTLKAKEAAAAAGIEEPVYEEKTFTHFIR
jgi:multimeric flavodoxin WrbA